MLALLLPYAGCEPRLDSPNAEERARAAARLDDQSALATIAVEDRDLVVRCAAIRRLADHALLAKIAVEAEEGSERAATFEGLSDQSLVAKIAVEDREWGVRMAAVARLTDELLIAEVAVGAPDSQTRFAAFQKLSTQAALASVASKSKDHWFREAAFAKLSDPAMFLKIACETENFEAGSVAAEKFTDQSTLAKIAVGAQHVSIRAKVIEKLTDQALLAKIAVEDPHEVPRLTAVGRLSDETVLPKIVREDKSYRVREAAADKLLARTALRPKIEGKNADPISYARAVAALDEFDPAIEWVAGGDPFGGRYGTGGAIARVKLALREPVIRRRAPLISLDVKIDEISAPYVQYVSSGTTQTRTATDVGGERVRFELRQAEKVLAAETWTTDFSSSVRPGTKFLPAQIEIGEFLSELLSDPAFTPDVLAELLQSDVAEVRDAASKIRDSRLAR